MEIINLIINSVVIVILILVIAGFKKRLDTQKTMLEDHNKMLDSIKAYIEIIDIKKLKEDVQEWIGLKEESIQLKSEKKVSEYQEIMMSVVQTSSDMKKTFTNQFKTLLRTAFVFLTYIPPHDRLEAINKLEDEELKKIFLEDIEEWPYAKRNALLEVLSTYTKVTAQKAGVKVTDDTDKDRA